MILVLGAFVFLLFFFFDFDIVHIYYAFHFPVNMQEGSDKYHPKVIDIYILALDKL